MTTRFTARRGCALVAGASLLVLAAACAKKDATTDTAAATPASSSNTSSSSGSTPMTQGQTEALNGDLRSYQLSAGTVDKAIAATRKMQAIEKANPQLVDAMNQEHGDANDAQSIDAIASHLDAMPPVKAVLSSVGISARDYVLTTLMLGEAGAAYQMQKEGKLPPNSELAKDVSPANIAYVGAHQAQLEALAKANGASDDGDD